jgi:hypothetical protein
MCSPSPEGDRIEEQDTIRTTAAGRSQTAEAGHYKGKNLAGLGATGRSRDWPARIARIFSRGGVRRKSAEELNRRRYHPVVIPSEARDLGPSRHAGLDIQTVDLG